MRLCMCACVCAYAHACLGSLRSPPFFFPSSLPPTSAHSLHNHFPSLPECLVESGDETKDDFISKPSRLSPVHRPFPCYSESGFGKVLSWRRERDVSPLPLCSPCKGDFAIPCSAVIGSPRNCPSPVLLAVTSQLRLGEQTV